MLNIEQSVLDKIIQILEKDKYDLIHDWIDDENVTKIFQKAQIDKEKFTDESWIWILQYFIGILKWEKKVLECPRMKAFVIYLYDKEFNSSDAFDMCSKLKYNILNRIHTQLNTDTNVVIELYKIFDKNFLNILKEFDFMSIQNKKLLYEHKNAIDVSSIVSKTDINWLITYVNKNFCDISWYSKEELLWKPHSIIKHPDTMIELFADLRDTIKAKKVWYWNIKNQKKDGSYYWVASVIVPILDQNDNIIEFIAIRRDVTKERDMIIKLGAHNKKKIERLKEISTFKDSFLSMASHEMRAPLTAIKWYLSMIIDWDVWYIDPEVAWYLKNTQNITKRLISLINDLLDLKKIESWNMEFVYKDTDIKKILLQVIWDMWFISQDKKVNIVPNIEFDNVLLSIDEDKFRQIMVNLVSNAVKFTPEWWTITISSNINDDIIEIVVKDTWIWIAQEEIKKVFEEFWQCKNKNTKWKIGTWLWMPIVKKLVEKMWWTISLSSVEWDWTSVYLKFPLKTK